MTGFIVSKNKNNVSLLYREGLALTTFHHMHSPPPHHQCIESMRVKISRGKNTQNPQKFVKLNIQFHWGRARARHMTCAWHCFCATKEGVRSCAKQRISWPQLEPLEFLDTWNFFQRSSCTNLLQLVSEIQIDHILVNGLTLFTVADRLRECHIEQPIFIGICRYVITYNTVL